MKHASLLVACLLGLTLNAASARADAALAPPGGGAGVGGTSGPAAPPLYVVDQGTPIPTNGAVLFESEGTGFSPVVELRRDGRGGDPVPGSMREVARGYWAWTPAEPFEVGGYTVRIVEPPGSTTSITVIEALELEPPRITTAPAAQWSAEGIREAYCRRWNGEGLVEDTAFMTRERGRIDVATGFASEADVALLHQFLFRALPAGAEATTFAPLSTMIEAGPYYEQDDEYCFAVEALRVGNNTLHRYPELTRVCAPHGDLADLEERDVAIASSVLERFVCQAPPVGYEARWCEVNRSCASLAPEDRAEDGCELYGYACLGESLASLVEREPGSDDPQGDALDGKSNGGCSVRAPSREGLGAPALLIALAMLVCTRRRAWPWLVALVIFASAGGARAEQDLALAGAGGLGVQAGAGAPPIPTAVLVHPSVPVPSNGSILLQGTPYAPDVIVLVDGVAIEGTVRNVTLDYWAWKATYPLPVGVVTVELPSAWGSSTTTVTVIEAIEIVPPAFTAAPMLNVTQSIDDVRYCQRWSSGMLFDDTVFATSEVGAMYLAPQLQTAESLALVHQFLYGVHMEGEMSWSFGTFVPGGYQAGPYAAQADEYCFRLEAMDLTASAIHPYPDLTPRCAAHGGLPALGEHEVEVPDSVLDRYVCQSPPDGFEDRWCALNASCAQLPADERSEGNGCLLYGHTCLGESLPQSTTSPPIVGGMTGGSQPPIMRPDPDPSDPDPSDPGTGGTQAMTTDMDDDAERAKLVKSGCGCFIGSPRDSTAARGAWSFGLALLVVAQRVLRRRA